MNKLAIYSDENSGLLAEQSGSLNDLINWFEHDVTIRESDFKEKILKIAGVTCGTLGSAFGAVQSYHFGEDYVSVGAGIALAIMAGISFSALSSRPFTILSEDALHFASSHEKKLLGKSNCNRSLAKHFAVAGSIVPGLITAAIMTYVNHTQFAPYSQPLAHVLNPFVYISRMILFGWATYIVGNMLRSSINRCYVSHKMKKAEETYNTIRLKLIDRLDRAIGKIQKMSQTELMQHKVAITNRLGADGMTFSNTAMIDNITQLMGNDSFDTASPTEYVKKAVGIAGGLIGFVSSYVLLPTGKKAGEYLGSAMGLDAYSSMIFGEVLGWSGLVSVSALGYFTTADIFEKTYASIAAKAKSRTCCAKGDPDGSKLKLVGDYLLKALFVVLSAASTVPRIQLTLVDSDLPFAANMTVIATAFISGFCRDYWALNGFYDDVKIPADKRSLVRLLNYVKQRVMLMSNEHVVALNNYIVEKRFNRDESIASSSDVDNQVSITKFSMFRSPRSLPQHQVQHDQELSQEFSDVILEI